MLRVPSIVMVLVAAAGCTERVNVCHSDSECTNPAYPFCDVNGEYDESGHTAMSCSIEPASCPVERCGCTPGAVTCSGDELATCNADGRDVTKETCSLSCAADGQRCQVFDPSNGLTNQLLATKNSPDVNLPDGTAIDTSDGSVKVNGVPMNVEAATVLQSGGPSIRVLLAHSWTVGNVRVTGSMPLALVSIGKIAANGVLDASGRGAPGPGSLSGSLPCVGGGSKVGGGGGGNLTPGAPSNSRIEVGSGGSTTHVGDGGASVGLTPFAGGCGGGSLVDGDPPTSHNNGGSGGGAVQLVSLTDVSVAGAISLGGGGGGFSSAGGGAGGNLLIEAPEVRVSGSIYANGGAGAACSMPGQDGQLSTSAAVGPSCTYMLGPQTFSIRGGNGGTSAIQPVSGGSSSSTGDPAGGGGAAGRVRIATKSGSADMSGSTVTAGLENVTLNPR